MQNLRLRARSHITLWAAFSLYVLLAFAGLAVAAEKVPTPPADPRISIHDGFVDETKCASCHANQTAAFAKSNHAKAMAIASDKSVRANFNNTRFEHNGLVS
ncbi:multiheme c-type cytochrome, partial [Phyllobacterium sp. P5_D12]